MLRLLVEGLHSDVLSYVRVIGEREARRKEGKSELTERIRRPKERIHISVLASSRNCRTPCMFLHPPISFLREQIGSERKSAPSEIWRTLFPSYCSLSFHPRLSVAKAPYLYIYKPSSALTEAMRGEEM